MTDAEFQRVVLDAIKSIDAVLAHKAKEYARGDRLSNFKKAAAAMSCTPEKACLGFWMKHVISICDMVNDIDRTNGVVVWNTALWDEKIGDSINYMILLKGLVRERLGNP